jgi:hypothetical protein
MPSSTFRTTALKGGKCGFGSFEAQSSPRWESHQKGCGNDRWEEREVLKGRSSFFNFWGESHSIAQPSLDPRPGESGGRF